MSTLQVFLNSNGDPKASRDTKYVSGNLLDMREEAWRGPLKYLPYMWWKSASIKKQHAVIRAELFTQCKHHVVYETSCYRRREEEDELSNKRKENVEQLKGLNLVSCLSPAGKNCTMKILLRRRTVTKRFLKKMALWDISNRRKSFHLGEAFTKPSCRSAPSAVPLTASFKIMWHFIVTRREIHLFCFSK